MKGKINSFGNLEIERVGKTTSQGCPFFYNEEQCGDWCSLFGEPTYKKTDYVRVESDFTKPVIETTISLCRKDIVFTDFVDERKEQP